VLRTTIALCSIPLAGALAGCSHDTTDLVTRSGEASLATDVAAGPSHITDAVLATLEQDAADRWNRTWNVSSDNLLAPGWVVQTPTASHWGEPYRALAMPRKCINGPTCDPDFHLLRCVSDADCGDGGRCSLLAATVKRPGDAPARLCVGHSDVLLDEMYRTMIAGEEVVDVTSLLAPDERFVPALRNAITFLGHTGRAVRVRVLFGAFPIGGVVNSKAVLRALTRDLPSSSPIEVFVGNFRSSNLPPSWNHSKIIAADGRVALSGGHNLWTQHYLDINPVHDLSMRVQGPAAADAHRFVNDLWAWTCANRSWLTWWTWSVWSNDWKAGAVGDGCPGPVTPPATSAAPAGDATVISVGRLAWVDPDNAGNDADRAIFAMLRAARHSISMSQQDFGPPQVPMLGIPMGDWPVELFDEIGAALVRGVEVRIVLSGVNSLAGGLGPLEGPYQYGWSLEETTRRIRQRMIENPVPGMPTGAALDDLLCERLHVTSLRFGPDETFPGGVTFPNHAKMVMVDDQAVYIGSQNLYNAGLSEHGYIVDDARAVAELRAVYWNPLWAASSRGAVTGAGAPTCALR